MGRLLGGTESEPLREAQSSRVLNARQVFPALQGKTLSAAGPMAAFTSRASCERSCLRSNHSLEGGAEGW